MLKGERIERVISSRREKRKAKQEAKRIRKSLDKSMGWFLVGPVAPEWIRLKCSKCLVLVLDRLGLFCCSGVCW